MGGNSDGGSDEPTTATIQFLSCGSSYVGPSIYEGGNWNNPKSAKTVEVPIGSIIIFTVPWYSDDTLTVYINGVSVYDQMTRIYSSTIYDTYGISCNANGWMAMYEYTVNGSIKVWRGTPNNNGVSASYSIEEL